ncbi:MAG: hypothetical protein M1834_002564 [Cirrosporium novae-zelandiae]|nr:MAG: hypothetical protein M1834_002564 [Cirrosporium novae-zelandiae]
MDAESDWNFPHQFDYIHSRFLFVGWKDWAKYFKQAYAALKPGGYLELQELGNPFVSLDPSLTPGTQAWNSNVFLAFSKTGKDLNAWKDFPALLKAAGFLPDSIKQTTERWPSNEKAARNEKERSMVADSMRNFIEVVQNMNPMLYGKVLGWSEEASKAGLRKTMKELKEVGGHIPV